ncbi:zinc finger protein 630 [Drosophila serrata]|uniref:zinc finger protein 630 n=1 Tax=Drosophila serrata TaxID=7274 RepID=UPI000A1D28DC|nr:zinc finger protein 630 [Drosophila serrata]
MPRSFSRFLSNRYNNERENLNERYQAVLPETSNISQNRKPRTTFTQRSRALNKSEININKRFTFHYGKVHPSSDWRHGDDIPIVVRREMEERQGEQLMELQPISEDHVFSHTIWRVQMPEQSLTLKPKIEGNPKDGIITAVAKPRGRRGRKPKNNLTAQATLNQKTLVEQVIKPQEVEAMEPPTPVKKPIERRQMKQKGEQFTCSTCSRTFNHSWLLVAHMRVHTGERPFVCPEQACQRSFSDRSNLRTHQRSMSHHNWEHQCGQCGKFFNQIFYLNRHTLDSCRKYLMSAMHRRS